MKLFQVATNEQLSTWHQKFAWLPTVVEGCVIWLEWYERRAVSLSLEDYDGIEFAKRRAQ